ncbi:MAG: alpha/beta fold hydrolase [Pseudomonadales bacterium]|nr:alpha/beta fold hydrolase [Pseudomonadales bacterium]
MLLHFQEYGTSHGDAEVIVLLHGLFGMSDNLQNLAKNLAENYRVIVPDLINHGASFHRPEMSYTAMANDVNQLLEALNIHVCKVMGHSMGGKVAMQLAHNFPLKVASLIVADIAPVQYQPRHTEIIAAMFAVAKTQILQRREADKILAGFIPESALRQFFMKNMFKSDAGLWQWRFGLDEIAAAYEDLSQAPKLRHVVDQPCLFIKGGASDYITEEAVPIIQRHYDNASCKIINDSVHWLHAEKPLIFNRLVLEFFSRKE